MPSYSRGSHHMDAYMESEEVRAESEKRQYRRTVHGGEDEGQVIPLIAREISLLYSRASHEPRVFEHVPA